MTKDPNDYEWGSEEALKCPYDFYEALREQCPVYEVPGKDMYLVTKHALVLEAARQPQAFSNHRKCSGPW